MRVARPRRLVGLLSLLALVAILVGVTGLELPVPRLGGGERSATPPLAGVRARTAEAVLRVGREAPLGAELAFLAVEPSGNLFVSDQGRQKLLRFDPAGQLLTEWGPRLGEATLAPAGVAVAGDEFYVVDRGTPRVLRLDASGRMQATISLEGLGTYGLNGLTLDADGSLYIADTGRNRILVFAPTGVLTGQIGHPGSGLGDFTQPMALAFAPDGSFFVADWENGRVERWERGPRAASGPRGVPDPTWTATDAWSTGFRPFGVAVDQLGRVFVPDTDRHRIEVSSPRGDPLGELGGPAGPVLDVAPRQLAFAPSRPRSLYALGADGVVRVDLEDTPPPPQQRGEEVDVASLAGLVLLVAVVVGVALTRRGRRTGSPRHPGRDGDPTRGASLGAATNGPVGLDAEDGAQRQDQQSRTDEELLLAHQPERKQQTAK